MGDGLADHCQLQQLKFLRPNEAGIDIGLLIRHIVDGKTL